MRLMFSVSVFDLIMFHKLCMFVNKFIRPYKIMAKEATVGQDQSVCYLHNK